MARRRDEYRCCPTLVGILSLEAFNDNHQNESAYICGNGFTRSPSCREDRIGKQLCLPTNLTGYLKNHKETADHHVIVVPKENILDVDGFTRLRQHFLTYKDAYSNDSHFVEALKSLAKIDDYDTTFSAIRSLFAFHRDRTETWFYIISCLRHFHGTPVMRTMVIALCHVPGHPDIFWGKTNIILEETRKEALQLLRRLTTRDDLLAMIASIDENGIDRGQIGQCVHAIVEVVDDNVSKLVSIAGDVSVENDSRYWAFILIIFVLQSTDLPRTIELTEQLRRSMPDELIVEVTMLCDSLRKHGYVACY